MPSASRYLLPASLKSRKLYSRLRRHLFLRKRQLFCTALVALSFCFTFRKKPHPTTIPAPPDQLRIPKPDEDVLQYAHRHADQHSLPVYILYKARSGQLNNQLISFFNALAIAKASNATLVAPFAFYGSESYVDFEQDRSFLFYVQQAFDINVYQPFLKMFGLYYRHDQLVGDYLDPELINEIQPVTSIMQFRTGEGGRYLGTFPHVLARKGDAPFYYMTLGKRSLTESNVNMRGETQWEDHSTASRSPASRRELDCNFNISDYFRGLSFHAGVNGNFMFLAKLYRSHSLNCTSTYPYWLKLRRNVQPRSEIRQLVHNSLANWGKVMTVHLRLFPFDMGKFTVTAFCRTFMLRFHELIREVDHIYFAYSVSSQVSQQIVSQLREALGEQKILTAQDYGKLHEKGPVFNKRYTAPLVDMWTGVNSEYFVGRLGSSLSWNVVYWREAFGEHISNTSNLFYKLEDFSEHGETNPTDSYGF